MRLHGAALAGLLAILMPAGALSADSTGKTEAVDPRAWPTAYEETSLTVKDLLAKARLAQGSLGDSVRTVRIVRSFKDGGLEGVDRETRSGDDFRVDSTIGPFTSAAGRFHGQNWETNENGYTLLKRSDNRRTEANAAALEREEPGDDVRVLGRLRSPADVYVLRVAPADGRQERRFYDATTFRLVRRETGYLGSLVVTTHEQYRTTDGITLAYRTTVSDGHPENDEVLNIDDVKVGVPVAESELEVPTSRRIPVVLPQGVDRVRLPARIDRWGHVIVRLTVKGRGLDFQLDSGAAGVVLDRDVARELGLAVHGRWSNTVAGTFTAGRTIIPKAEAGPVTVGDFVVDALPFAQDVDWSTKIVGLLGYDFIAGCVIKIDYDHGTVDAIRYSAFEPPADAYVLDANLDEQVPVVQMRVNDAVGEHFVLDTGADDVVFFSGFAAKHPAAVDDHSPKKVLSRLFPIVQASGVGGNLSIRPVMIAQMQLGNVSYTDHLAFVMAGNQPSFEGEDFDGLVGVPALRAFDVYLDYANSRVVLVPNATTKKRNLNKPKT